MRRTAWAVTWGLLLAPGACAHAPPGAAAPPAAVEPVRLRLLAINDFHGQLEPAADGSAPGAAVLAAALREARAGYEGRSLVLHAGDLVGASPASSALLQDEPAVAFFSQLGNGRCAAPTPTSTGGGGADPGCDLVGALGNHELDEGLAEFRRLLDGGTHRRGPFLLEPWPGARYPTTCANLVDAASGQPVLPPWVVREVGGVRIGVVGVVRDDLATKVSPARLAGLAVRPVAGSVNRAVAELRALGVRAVVVLLHRGGRQAPYPGDTRPGAPAPGGAIAPIVAELDGEVDVVVSGDEHQFTNALLPAADGRPVLVTQALEVGRAFAQIDLEVDPRGGDVVAKRAAIRPVPAAEPEVAALVAAARSKVAALTGRRVATAAEPIGREPAGGGGDSPLGDLTADATRAAAGADAAVVNAGALRADLPAGPITVGHVYAVVPFGNPVVTVRVTGRQLRALLEQQWLGQPEPRRLHVAGFEYAWDERRPPGARVVALTRGGRPLAPDASLTLAMPAFVADGGDGFAVAAEAAAAGRVEGQLDLEALTAWLAAQPQPLRARADGRVRQAN